MTQATAPKLGRPPLPESERATAVVKVRLRESDAAALHEAAAQAGEEPAAWAREAIVARLRRRR